MTAPRTIAIAALAALPASAACLLSIDEGLIHDVPADAASSVEASCSDAAPATYVGAVLCDHPIAYWRLGESNPTTIARDELAAHNGTYVGTVAFGRPGAIAHDPSTSVGFGAGASSFMVAPGRDLLFTGKTTVSYEAWIRPTEMNDGTYFCPLSNDGASTDGRRQGYALCLSTMYGISFERFHDSAEEEVVTHGNFSPPLGGPFIHLVGTYDGSVLTLYVNAVVYGPPAPSTALIDDHPELLTIGARPGGSLRFTGDVDDVAIYGYALTPQQVLTHYNLGKP